MTGGDIVLQASSVIGALGLGGVITGLIAWRRFGPQDKAKVAQIAAETRNTDADTFDKMLARIDKLSARIEQQDAKIDSLERTIREQGEQIAALHRRNRDLGATMRDAVKELLAWIKKALAVMTPDQQTNVGPPPDYNHLITPPEKG